MTACCTFQLIELMRTMDTHKEEEKNVLKSLPNKTASVTYKFWTPWDGNKKKNWKKYRQAALQYGATFLCTALVTCQSWCHPPACSASTSLQDRFQLIWETSFSSLHQCSLLNPAFSSVAKPPLNRTIFLIAVS